MTEKEKFLEGLRRADAAGDKDAVVKLKAAYDKKFGSQQAQPEEEPYRQTEVSPVGAAIRGIGEGLFAGKGEYVSAVGATAADVMEGVVDSLQKGDAGSIPNIVESYNKNLMHEQKLNERAEKEFPAINMASDVVGTAIGERAFFGLSSKLGGARYANSLSGYLSTHGAFGAAHGLLRSDEQTLKGKIDDMLTGGALGTLGGSVGIAAGTKGIKALEQGSEKISQKAFLNWLGIDKPFKFQRKLQSSGKQLDEFAERLFTYDLPDSKNLGKTVPVIDIMDTKEEMFYKVLDASKIAGKAMSDTIDNIDVNVNLKKQLDAKGLYREIVEEIFDGEDFISGFQQPLKERLVAMGGEASEATVNKASKMMNPDDRATQAKLQRFVYETFFDSPVIDKDGVITNAYQQHSEPSLRRMWEFSQGIRKKAAAISADEQKVLKMTMAEKSFFDGKVKVAKKVNEQLENAIDASGIITGNPELYKQYAANRLKYGDLAETRDLLNRQLNKNPNAEWLSRLSKNAVFSSMSLVGGLGAMAGMDKSYLILAGAAASAIAESPSVQGGVAKGARKLAQAFKTKPDKYAGAASTLVNSLMHSEEMYMRDLSLISAEVDLREAPMPRNSGEVIGRSDSLLTLLQAENPAMAEDLRAAIQQAHKTGNTSMLTGMMAEIAAMPKLEGMFAKGIGWDGRAITDADKAAVEQKLQTLSKRKRANLIPKFRETGMIPDEFYEEENTDRQAHFIFQKAKQKIRKKQY